MMHGEFVRVPDDGGDRVTLLQRLVHQILSGLPSGSQYSDLHPQTLMRHTDFSRGRRTLMCTVIRGESAVSSALSNHTRGGPFLLLKLKCKK